MANLKQLLRLRASLDTADEYYTYLFISGKVYANIPGEPSKPLFRVNGFNKAKLIQMDETQTKYMLNSKEVLFYEDLGGNRIMDTWDNPFTGETNEVFPIYNDPVNIPLFASFVRAPDLVLKDQMTSFVLTIPLQYPNPIPIDQYPGYSTGDTYVSSETFMYTGWTDDIKEGSEKQSAPTLILWSRTSPWLPWMKMGTRPGNLHFFAYGWKLSGVVDIPPYLAERIEKQFSDFHGSPKPLGTKNASSWTTFKDILDKRRESGQSEIILSTDDQTTTGPGSGKLPDQIVEKPAISVEILTPLQDKEFTFSISGNAFRVGCGERMPVFAVKGSVTLKSNINCDKVKFATTYEIDICDLRSGKRLIRWNNPITSSDVDVPEIKGSSELEVPFSDIQVLCYNAITAFTFTAQDGELWSMSNMSLAFPNKERCSEDEAFMGAMMALPWPSWMNMDEQNGYIVASFMGQQMDKSTTE